MNLGPSIVFAVLAVTRALAAAAEGGEAEMAKIQKRVVIQGRTCPDPAHPCALGGERFKANELSFEAPLKFAFDRGEDRSAPFFAVILKSAPRCSLAEEQRLRIQALFPRNKVFLHRYLCEDFADKVTYTNVDRKRDFIAVHAGATETQARAFLAKARAAGFPDANPRRMQVVVTWQLE